MIYFYFVIICVYTHTHMHMSMHACMCMFLNNYTRKRGYKFESRGVGGLEEGYLGGAGGEKGRG